MIHEVTGDILLTKAQLIAQGVGPDDHMENGLALQLRQRWPAMAKDFRHWCATHAVEPGGAFLWSGPGVKIVNLLTQDRGRASHDHPGRAHVSHVNHSLRELKRIIQKEHVKSVALPRIATGVGGLDWGDVKPLVERHLGDLDVHVYVYTTYRKGAAADEPT